VWGRRSKQPTASLFLFFLSVRVRVSSLSRSDLIGHLFFLFSLDFQTHDSDLHSSEAPVPLIGSVESSRCGSSGCNLFGVWNNTHRHVLE
jgi:hypothetical protein